MAARAATGAVWQCVCCLAGEAMLPVCFPQPRWMYERGGLGCCRVVPLWTATHGRCALHYLPASASLSLFCGTCCACTPCRNMPDHIGGWPGKLSCALMSATTLLKYFLAGSGPNMQRVLHDARASECQCMSCRGASQVTIRQQSFPRQASNGERGLWSALSAFRAGARVVRRSKHGNQQWGTTGRCVLVLTCCQLTLRVPTHVACPSAPGPG